ncbi:MAG: hypothetical protein LBS11_02000 [Oscillospiraceae bacterium]|nr:hypothetical protein [Oscillospiraceae bacterium]
MKRTHSIAIHAAHFSVFFRLMTRTGFVKRQLQRLHELIQFAQVNTGSSGDIIQPFCAPVKAL